MKLQKRKVVDFFGFHNRAVCKVQGFFVKLICNLFDQKICAPAVGTYLKVALSLVVIFDTIGDFVIYHLQVTSEKQNIYFCVFFPEVLVNFCCKKNYLNIPSFIVYWVNWRLFSFCINYLQRIETSRTLQRCLWLYRGIRNNIMSPNFYY